jgi:methylglutamate dehydrogenase subunit B
MRIPCPLCGLRDRREFYYAGAADLMKRPASDAPPEDWDAYLHLRDNPAGPTRELWFHETGCGAWLVVERDTLTHQIHAARLTAETASGGA